MPRIRTIKPEFWSDEKLSLLSPIDRLVFLGLIGLADDYGRVHDNVKVIDAFVFPNSSETVRESLANLSRIGRIVRGNSSSGQRIIEIVNWSKHQRVDKPQMHIALPPIVEVYDENTEKTNENNSEKAIRESFANHSGIVPEQFRTVPTTYDQGSGTRDLGEGAGKGTGEGASAPPRTKSKFVAPTLEEAKAYSLEAAITLNVELFFDHYEAQGWVQSNGRALKDWRAAMRKWARRDALQSPGLSTPSGPRATKTFAQQRLDNTKRAIEEFSHG